MIDPNSWTVIFTIPSSLLYWFCQQPRNKSRWAVISPLWPRPRGRAAEMVPQGALAVGWIQSGSGPLRVGKGDPEGPGERGGSDGAQKGDWNENIYSKVWYYILYII